MAAVQDDELFRDYARCRGKVVVITGAANGIGKETALKFASFGAKIVVADLDVAGGNAVVAEIHKSGGHATFKACNVTVYEQVLSVYEHALETYKTVDIVVVNAGITEAGSFSTVSLVEGKPAKPVLKTLDVNLTGAVYTIYLAQHYLTLNRPQRDSLKAIIVIGSMASWAPIPLGPMYTASKHAMLGVMRSLHPTLEADNIRISSIHPFFVDTGIVPIPVKLFMAGIPLAPISRVAGAIFYAATNPDPATNGCAYLLTDDGPVFKVPKEEFKLGVYELIDGRKNKLFKAVNGIRFWSRWFADVLYILRKPFIVATFVAVVSLLLKTFGYL